MIASTLTDTASKAQELDHWREFLNQLPPCSYLALYLRESTPILENAMRQDWTCEPIGQIRRMTLEALKDESDARAKVAELRKQRDDLAREIAGIRRDVARVRDGYSDALGEIRTLLKTAESAHATANGTLHRALEQKVA